MTSVRPHLEAVEEGVGEVLGLADEVDVVVQVRVRLFGEGIWLCGKRLVDDHGVIGV